MSVDRAVGMGVRVGVGMNVLLDDVFLRVAGEQERQLFDLADDALLVWIAGVIDLEGAVFEDLYFELSLCHAGLLFEGGEDVRAFFVSGAEGVAVLGRERLETFLGVDLDERLHDLGLPVA